MKNTIKFLVLLLMTGIGFSAGAAEYVNLTINYTISGTQGGFDHLTKMRVYIDGNEAGDNTPKKQSLANSITVEVSKGNHTIKAVLLAKNENIWEERTIDNNYSLDCIYEKSMNFTADKSIDLVFDLKALDVIDKLAKPIEKGNTNKDNNSSKSSVVQNSKTALQKVNDFLKTFDNGYYGYLEIIDGYLYDRFPSGKYTKSLMSDLSKAEEETYKRKVRIKCKNDADCVFSTYTDSYHKQLSFSQSSDFNTSELISLLNNLISAYSNTTAGSSDDLDKYKSNSDIVSRGNTETKNTSSTTNTNSTTTKNKPLIDKALKELNDYMITLDNGRYKGFKVEGDYLVNYYENNNSSKAKISDLGYVKDNKEFNYVKLACTGDKECVYSSITKGYHEYFNFNISAGKSSEKMVSLLNNFLDALKGKSSTTASTSTSTTTSLKSDAQKLREQKEKERLGKTISNNEEDDFWGSLFDDVTPSEKSTSANPSKYAKPLNDLNAYLKTFNPETYGDVEVRGSDVIFNFKFSSQKFNSSISITSLTGNTTVIKGKSAGTFGTDEIKILCKNESKCFYSSYSKGTTDHFRFYSNKIKDLTKMEQLVKEFINALK